MPVLSFTKVFKKFGARTVLNDVNLIVEAGELLVLLGPNGAGKSTALALATGLARPSGGEVRIGGFPAGSLAARREFAFVPQEASFPMHATGRQVLRFLSAHSEHSVSEDSVIESWAMADFVDRPVRQMSGGQRRLISIAGAMIRQPRFVIMDEPTVGLDLEARRLVYSRLAEFTQVHGTVLMTTHFLYEAEALASRIVVLSAGRVVQSGSPTEIKRRFGFKRISFKSSAEPPDSLGARYSPAEGLWRVDCATPDQALKDIIKWGQAEEIEVVPLALEDVFTRVLQHEGAGG